MNLYYEERDGKRYVTSAPPGTPICDFCSAPNPEKIYPARDAEVVPDHMSEGGWAACKGCAQLIDANDREGLLQRSILMFAGRVQYELDEETIAILRMVHDKFFALRL